MRCPECDAGELKVTHTYDRDGQVARRRQCRSCGARFTTSERFVNRRSDTSITKTSSSISRLFEILSETSFSDLSELDIQLKTVIETLSESRIKQ